MGLHTISLPDADIQLDSHCFDAEDCQYFFEVLHRAVVWRQEIIHLYGKPVPLPRLIAWYGNPERSYRFSGLDLHPQPWLPSLLRIKQQIETVSGATFNSVLLNYYPSGNSSIAWHSDDEPELGKNPTIASVSFGATRRFQLRHNQTRERYQIELTNGSLLIMQGTTQHYWQHALPKTKKPTAPRINLTFRTIASHR